MKEFIIDFVYLIGSNFKEMMSIQFNKQIFEIKGGSFNTNG
jgi:hypothetical protein